MAILNHGSTLRTADGGQTTTTIVTAANIGTYGVAANSTYYVGTTQNIFNRASGAQTLTGVSIDGNAANITAYTINQNVGTANAPSFAGATLTSTLSITGGDGLRAFRAGAATITSHLYWANTTNTVAYNWQLDENNNAAMWGYTSAWGKLLTVTSAGAFSASGDVRAPIFYDSNDTAYYCDPASTSRLNTLQATRINFGATGATPYTSAAGEGFGNGITFGGDDNSAYYRIFTAMENVGGNYSKLTLNWHTGIRIGAFVNYGGVRFYNNSVGQGGTEIFSVGNLDSNVRVVNNLIVNGITINQERANNARMYGAATGAFGLLGLDSAGSFRWQLYGEGSNYGFLDSAWGGWDINKVVNGQLDIRVSGGLVRVLNAGNYVGYSAFTSSLTSTVDARAPIFYDSNDTAYYVNPNSSSNLSILRVFSAFDTASSDVYANMRVMRNNATNDGMYIGYGNLGSTGGITRIFGGGATTGELAKYIDYTLEPNSFRAPIFYDSNDTAYYTDPNGTSVLNRLKIDGGNFANNYFQSLSDFVSGTLVTTDIPATAANGLSFVMNVVGKSYNTTTSPFNFSVQGYLYNSTIINYSGLSLDSTGLTTIKIFENGGFLCFWWARVSYWNAFEVSVRSYDAAKTNYNRVTNITDVVEPTGTKKVTVTMQTFLRSDVSATNSVDLRAPIFYDSNDTAYYTDPSSLSNILELKTNKNWYDSSASAWGGGINMGGNNPSIGFQSTASTWWYMLHHSSSNINFYRRSTSGSWNHDGIWDSSGNFIWQGSSVRAPIFYDQNNTALYCDPNGTSNFTGLTVANTITGSVSGNAATATNVAWTGITGGARTNYLLEFQPPVSSYAGFAFKTSAAGEAGYFLVRGASDNDVYTAEGITLVADAGWLTLAQRTTASRGVRIMTGTSSSERLKITTAGDIQFVNGNSFTYNSNVVLHAGNYGGYSAFSGSVSSGGNITATGYIFTSTYLQTGGNLIYPSGYGATQRLEVSNSANNTWITGISIAPGGIVTAPYEMRSPIFYDSNDTTYYLDPANTTLSLKTRSSIVINNASAPNNLAMLNIGYSGGGETRAIDIQGSWSGGENKSITFTHSSGSTNIVAQINAQHNGPGSKLRWGKLHHSGDSSTYTMELISESTTSAYLTVAGSVRAPIFYDQNNTAYYVDPAGTSILNAITYSGVQFWQTDSVYAKGTPSYGYRFNNYSDSINAFIINNSGDTTAYSSSRAPIFYDSDNTGYYLNPASTSNLNSLDIAGTLSSAAYNNLSNDYKDIYVYGDVNTYYVVLIQGEYIYSFGRYSVTRGYNWTGPDTWNTASHKGGLTLDWEWSGDTAWGGNDKAIRIIEFNESYSTMVAGLGYPVNGGVIIWLRGGGVGGAQYRIRTPIGSNTTVTAYDGVSATNHSSSTTFTASDSTVFSTRANVNNVSAEILARYPVRNAASLYSDGNLVVDTGSSTQTKSGIFASAASVRAPIFYDTDNTGYYVDPNSTSNLVGLTVANTITGSISGNSGTVGGLSVHSGRNNEANKVVRTDSNGYIQAGWINTTSGNEGTTAIDRVYASYDGYIRYYTPANFRTVLDVPTRGGSGASGSWGISVTGSSASCTGNAATVTTNANLTGHITSVGNTTSLGSFTSAQLLAALTDETGTGANVFATSPTLVSPILGTPTSGNLANCTFPTLNQNTTGSSASCTGNAATVTNGMYLSGDQFISGAKYFTSNKGAASTVGANATYSLEAYSSDAGAAGMSFHRGGYYAVNMGLDPDNVLRIGGWSASANRLQLDMSGNLTIAAGMYATGFYDTNNTALYCDPTGTSLFTGLTVTNTITGSINGTANGLNSSNYIARTGTSGNYNTDFQNTPAGTVRHQGDDSTATNNPGGTWWFVDNYRHSNSSNYWGTQVAWGWEDQANKLATRNITANSFGSWVYYLNSVNYNSYSPTLTGTGASGTWSINVTGNAGGSSASCTGNAGSVTYLPNRTDSAVYQVLWGAAYTNGSGTIAYSCSPVYIQSSTGFLYANAFIDAGNTAYYIDPASTSILNLVRTRNTFGERITVTSASSTTIDTQYNVTELTMSAFISTLTFSNIQASGIVHMWTIVTLGNGSATSVTWPAAIKWPGGTAPNITGTNTKRDIYQFVTYDGGTSIYAIIVGQNL
jgi:hypothetical protein